MEYYLPREEKGDSFSVAEGKERPLVLIPPYTYMHRMCRSRQWNNTVFPCKYGTERK